MPSFDKSKLLRNATPEQMEEFTKRVNSIVESVEGEQAKWLESHHFPPDITRATRLAMAEVFGDFVTAEEIDGYAVHKVRELLETCVDRRHWLIRTDGKVMDDAGDFATATSAVPLDYCDNTKTPIGPLMGQGAAMARAVTGRKQARKADLLKKHQGGSVFVQQHSPRAFQVYFLNQAAYVKAKAKLTTANDT